MRKLKVSMWGGPPGPPASIADEDVRATRADKDVRATRADEDVRATKVIVRFCTIILIDDAFTLLK